MLSLEEAKSKILDQAEPLGSEVVPLSQSLHRFASVEIRAGIDLPPFDNSAMDGYAVKSTDLKKATVGNPVWLQVVGKLGAGEAENLALENNCCVRIFTGSRLPSDCDAVVMQEDVRLEGERIVFHEPVQPFENVRLKGEDVRTGTTIIRKGSRINPTCRALISACGIGAVEVFRRLKIALLATGNELKEPGAVLRPGEIFESNRLLLSGFLENIADVVMFPIVRDDPHQTTEALRKAFAQCDLVLTTGGVSVGEFDFVKDSFVKLGGQIELWKIAIRPGKPFVFGALENQFLFGLPGNPVSALVTFLLLVRPALLKMSGAKNVELPLVEGELEDELLNNGDRRHFMRVRWEEGKVRRAGPQASHMVGALGDANGLVDVPPKSRLMKGDAVTIQLWQPDG
jgi:molybdopterin molybdotransferase